MIIRREVGGGTQYLKQLVTDPDASIVSSGAFGLDPSHKHTHLLQVTIASQT